MSRLQTISLCFIGGIAIGAGISASFWGAFHGALFAAAIAGGTLTVVALRRRIGRALPIILLALMSGLCVCICCSFTVAPRHPINRPCLRILEGVVTTPPIWTPNTIRLSMHVSAMSQCVTGKQNPLLYPTNEIAYISIGRTTAPATRSHSHISKGHRIRLTAQVQPKRRHAKDFAVPTPMSHYCTAFIAAESHIAIINRNAVPIESWLQKRRGALGTLFFNNMSDENARLAIALTTGQRGVLPETLVHDFRNIGAIHLLVVSGLHLGIIALLTWQIALTVLSRVSIIAQRFNVFRVCSGLTMPVIIIFVLFTGANPPAVRACVMVISVLLAHLLYRQANGFQSLTLAAVLLLAYSPSLIANPGFQLSFVCVAAFLLFRYRPAAALPMHQVFCDKPTRNQTLPMTWTIRIWQQLSAATQVRVHRLFRISIIAFAVTAPVLSLHFHSMPWISPIANMIMVPLVSILILPLLIVSALIGAVDTHLALPLIHIAETLIKAFKTIAHVLSGVAPAIPTENGYASIAVSAAAIAVLLAMKKKYLPCALTGAVCLLAVLWTTVFTGPVRNDRLLTIDFLDAGQGDATLLTFPDGSHWLIDAGGTASQRIGRDYIVPVLNRLHVRFLNKIVLTHPDPDHVAGIPDVLRAIKTREIIENGQGREETAPPVYTEMMRLAQQQGIPVFSGTSLCKPQNVHGVAVQVIHPCAPGRSYLPWLSFNDNSIVIQLTYGRHRVLLTGDLSQTGEQHLLATTRLKPSTLLKLGHHGSAGSTSEPFLKRVHPRFAIASCGYYNRYGFPAREVVNRLRYHHVTLLETGQNGWIRALVGRKTIKIIPQKSPSYLHF